MAIDSDLQETSSEGAARETREEALAEVQVVAPYSYWDIPQIGQVNRQQALTLHTLHDSIRNCPSRFGYPSRSSLLPPSCRCTSCSGPTWLRPLHMLLG